MMEVRCASGRDARDEMADHDDDIDNDRGREAGGSEAPPVARPTHPTPAGEPRFDDWFWWTDVEQHRPVSQAPQRPDLPPLNPTASHWDMPHGAGSFGSGSTGWAGGPQHSTRRGRGSAILAAVVAAVVLIASGVGIGWGLSQGHSRASSSFVVPPPGGGPGPSGDNGGGTAASRASQSVLPAVVVIRTEIGTGAPGALPIGGAAGTGMLLTSTGEILTNNHVIRGATGIRVTVANQDTYDAEVIGADPTDDVALLQITGASGLPTVATDTSNLTKGTAVFAIGNAFGQGSASTTSGTVTALDQSITAGDAGSAPEKLDGLIQTNAPISPGDSGGPLVDSQGEVVGMITAASRTSSVTRTSTEGYAIAIEDALGIVNRIRSGDTTGDIVYGRPGLLGVQARNMTATAAGRLGVPQSGGGALVIQVVPGTPAAGAGMTAGSAITTINGHAIGNAADLSTTMHTTKPGQSASVTWIDTSGSHSATVQLITAPAV
jgi:S1-C subfamily serine protease